MKIAVVAPSPVPFTVGGAENLCFSLVHHINTKTAHQAELIKLPSPELSCADLIAGYEAFYRLDLFHFDLVISTKYPSWMVRHPNHACYMLHKLRGLYDTYPSHLPLEPVTSIPEVLELLALMSTYPTDNFLLDDVLAGSRELFVPGRYDDDVIFSFPGPLIRKIVHFLDSAALSTRRIKKYAAISRNVAHRKDYFPKGVSVHVAHPPSGLDTLPDVSYDYLFTASRLDGPKRLELLVEAMKDVRSQVRLKIAGTGPREEALKAMAEGDDRIVFLGRVSEDELCRHYAHALAVPFFPVDEDYGYITLEAMKSAKPVLTTHDAGGPNELIRDGETGFSVPPDPRAIAEKIDLLCTNLDLTRQMGEKAREWVADITWENVCRVLVEPETPAMKAPDRGGKDREKLLVALTFPVYPPRSGGQVRVFELYRRLAMHRDVDLVCLSDRYHEPRFQWLCPGLRQVTVSKSPAHLRREREMFVKLGQRVPVEDATMPALHHLTPEYLEVLRRCARGSSVLIASHPYLVDALLALDSRELWYEAHNVEWLLKKDILPDTSAGRKLLDEVCRVEHLCCERARVIFVCSREDGHRLASIHGADPRKMVTVPNGVDVRAVPYRTGSQRLALKKRLGLVHERIACFMGSYHPPNMDAVEIVLETASQCPGTLFFIIGSVCGVFQESSYPPNVHFLGMLEEVEKQLVLGCCDLALNPMRRGSGTNLKLLDYFASGAPVLSTPFGIRGMDVEPERHLLISDVEDFAKGIERFFRLNRLEVESLRRDARALVEEKYDWQVIAGELRSWLTGKAPLE